MKILICTGIYPPHVGGPSQYAKEVETELKNRGHSVKVLTYKLERKLPPLIRHELFFWRTLFNLKGVDFIFALDTFSVGWPAAVAAKLLRKKIVIRTGGDFLWESYVERTGDLVLLSSFYQTRKDKLNRKEKFIFEVTKWTLQNVNAVIFSTEWQKKIFEEAYDLDSRKNYLVENFYGNKIQSKPPQKKVFVAGSRPLKWKNIERLKKAFELARKDNKEIELDLESAPYEKFLEKIKNSFVVILVSIGDISPNMILDAIRCNKPFILTKENGLYDKLKDIAIFADPENVEDIKEKILFISDNANYSVQKKKIESFTFTHSWSEICDEIINISEKI